MTLFNVSFFSPAQVLLKADPLIFFRVLEVSKKTFFYLLNGIYTRSSSGNKTNKIGYHFWLVRNSERRRLGLSYSCRL